MVHYHRDSIIEYYLDLVENLKYVDPTLKRTEKLSKKFNQNNRKLQHPFPLSILRNLVNKILEIHQRTIHQRIIHQRIIQGKLDPSITSNMVKQALLLRHHILLGNSFETHLFS